MKDQLTIKDYTMYLGCEVSTPNGVGIIIGVGGGVQVDHDDEITTRTYNASSIKLILRKISDMTEEEKKEFATMIMDSPKLEERINSDEVSIETIDPIFGSVITLDVNCRCYIGIICIYSNGDVDLYDEEGQISPYDELASKIKWLIERGFDVFGYIEKGLAIDKSKI